MTDEVDISKIATWHDAVRAANGDFTKARDIWARVKEAKASQKGAGGGGSSAVAEEEEGEWISEHKELDELLSRAGIADKKRRKYIVDMYFNTDDFDKLDDPKYMNSILRVARVSADKRKMVLMAWYNMDEAQVDRVLKEASKGPYSTKSSYAIEEEEEVVKKDPLEVVDEQLMKELEIKRKKLEMKRALQEMREIEKELSSYENKGDQENKKVKVPLRDRYGNIVKDAEGKIVYVWIDPQEEYERQRLEQMEPVREEKGESKEFEMMMQMMMNMMQQQNQMMMAMLESNKNTGGNDQQIEFLKQVLEQMKQDKEQTMMTVQKLQQEIEKKRREELEERLEQLQQGLVEMYKKMSEGPSGPLDALEQIKQLKQEYPELFGGVNPDELRLQMDATALKNSFEIMKKDHEMLASTLEDIKDLYKQKLINDMRLQALKEEAELARQGLVPPQRPAELTPERLENIEKKIKGKKKS